MSVQFWFWFDKYHNWMGPLVDEMHLNKFRDMEPQSIYEHDFLLFSDTSSEDATDHRIVCLIILSPVDWEPWCTEYRYRTISCTSDIFVSKLLGMIKLIRFV